MIGIFWMKKLTIIVSFSWRKNGKCKTVRQKMKEFTEVIITRMIYDKNVIDFGSDI